MMLYKVVRETHNEGLHHEVVSLTTGGALADRVREAGAIVHELGWSRSRLTPRQLWALRQLIKRTRPDVVQTWMYHADVAGSVASRLAGVRNIVWNIQNGTLPRGVQRSTRLTMRIAALLSWLLPKRIIVCSRRSMATHASYGYDRRRMTYIPNGVDTQEFARGPRTLTCCEQSRPLLLRSWWACWRASTRRRTSRTSWMPRER